MQSMRNYESNFVITGTRYAGIGAVASMFRQLGIENALEKHYSPFRLAQFGPKKVTGEASWLLAYYLDQLPTDTCVIHCVRHPMDVAARLVHDPMMKGEGAYGHALSGIASKLFKWQYDVADRAILYVDAWNALIEDYSSRITTFTLKVDDMSSADLKSMATSVRYNYMERPLRIFQSVIGPGMLDDPEYQTPAYQESYELLKMSVYWPKLVDLCNRYGYDSETGHERASTA